jgi:hypothetical protein
VPVDSIVFGYRGAIHHVVTPRLAHRGIAASPRQQPPDATRPGRRAELRIARSGPRQANVSTAYGSTGSVGAPGERPFRAQACPLRRRRGPLPASARSDCRPAVSLCGDAIHHAVTPRFAHHRIVAPAAAGRDAGGDQRRAAHRGPRARLLPAPARREVHRRTVATRLIRRCPSAPMTLYNT